MKQTLLQMTQDILSNLSSDEVNSISDNSESMQVATIIRQKYFDILSRIDLPTHDQLCQLNPSLDPTAPVLMYVPQGISEIKYIKYFDSNILDGNTSSTFAHDLNVNLTTTVNAGTAPPGYLYVPVLPNDEFIDMVNGFSTANPNVKTFTLKDTSNGFNGSFTFNYRNDSQPTYCTIISNYYVIFNSYDSSQDSTLQSNKTMCLGTVIPVFLMQDNFIPDLADEQFPLLINEAKELAFYELKQMPHPLAEKEVHRGWSAIQKKKSVMNRPTYFDELPGFGRKHGYYGYRGGYYAGDSQYINSRGSAY